MKLTLLRLMATIGLLVLAACAQEPEPIDIGLLHLSPPAGAENVEVTEVSVGFPVPINQSSFQGSPIRLSTGGAQALGEISYDSGARTLTFVPLVPLQPSKLYTATLDQNVPLQGARRLSGPVSWSFTTAAEAVPGAPDEGPSDDEPQGEQPGGEQPGDDEPPGEDPSDEEPGQEDPGEAEPGTEEPTLVVFAISNSLVEYDGTMKRVTITSDPSDVPFVATYAIGGESVTEPINAGTYDVTVSVTDEAFSGSASGQLVITPRSIVVTASDAIKSVGEDDPELSFVARGELVAGDFLAGALSREVGETPGTYQLELGTLSAGPNYGLTLDPGVLIISAFRPGFAVGLASAFLQNEIQAELAAIVGGEARLGGQWSFGSSPVGHDEPTPQSVAGDLGRVAGLLQPRVDALTCGSYDAGNGVTVELRIYVAEMACSAPLPPGEVLGSGRFVSGSARGLGGNQRYALPFAIVAVGLDGEFSRRVVLYGEYQFVVGQRSFARYALFTDRNTDGPEERVWFSDQTLIDGPVHTNGNFAFAGRAWFGGSVASAGISQGLAPGAFGYDGGGGRFFSADLLDRGGSSPDLSVSGRINRPELVEGVDWRAAPIELPVNAHDQRQVAMQNGLYFTLPLNYLELFAGDATGLPIPPYSVGGADYQYVRAEMQAPRGAGQTITYRINREGTLEAQYGSDPTEWNQVAEQFNGVIYSEAPIARLRGPGRLVSSRPDTARPALAEFAQLTIVAAMGARITSDLVYEDQPCAGVLRREASGLVTRADCANLNAKNVLGIFSPGGDILIGNNQSPSTGLNAPDNVRIQASMLASNGVVRVENARQAPYRGAVELLGGIIERDYGIFGAFETPETTLSGYSRSFTFDPRFAHGLVPPYFPTVETDGVTDVQTLSGAVDVSPWHLSSGD